MDVVFFVVEVLLWLIDGAVLLADVHAWIRGKENRMQRKQARLTGADVPPRDSWNRRVVTLTVLVALCTGALLVWTF